MKMDDSESLLDSPLYGYVGQRVGLFVYFFVENFAFCICPEH